MRFLKLVLTSITCALLLVFSPTPGISEDQQSELDQKKQEIEQIQQELERLQGEKQTLSSTISYLDSKIKLTQAQIYQTEAQLTDLKSQIKALTEKISNLDTSLSDLTQQLLHRVNFTYKTSRINPFLNLLASNNLNQLISRFKYLQAAQIHHRHLIYQLETARTDFDQQKTLKQQKEEELKELNLKLASQKLSLAAQQRDKQQLLEVTKNDEKKFQADLAKAVAELEAIQAIIAGKGDEEKVKDVNEGDTIATIMRSGPNLYACSSGPHLHFEVVENEQHHNPFNYLSPKDFDWDDAGYEKKNSQGSWRWPIHDRIRITQDYGVTPYSSRYAGNFHTGVDMVSDSSDEVMAVKKGTLYRGGISCYGGTLQYVRVEHDDGKNTYYLHVNY